MLPFEVLTVCGAVSVLIIFPEPHTNDYFVPYILYIFVTYMLCEAQKRLSHFLNIISLMG